MNSDSAFVWSKQGKKVALLGGDHSTPLGYYEALAEMHNDFGILHLDAHMDLRIAYEGFTYSHASIMYNTLQLPQVSNSYRLGSAISANRKSRWRNHKKIVSWCTLIWT
jgi:agmatinase